MSYPMGKSRPQLNRSQQRGFLALGGGGTPGQAWQHTGVPYPTYSNASLVSIGYTAWGADGGTVYDPCLLQPAALPDPWTTNQTGFYYVEAGGGGSAEGNPTAPISSLPSAPPAGAVIVVSDAGGTFTGQTLTWSNGTAADPIFLVAASGDTPTFTTAMSIGGSHVITDGITVTGSMATAAWTHAGGSHMCARNCSFTNAQTTGNGAVVGFGTDYDHCMYYNCSITGTDGTNDIDRHGIGVGVGSHAYVIDNTITGANGDGCQVGDQNFSPNEVTFTFLSGNTVTTCKQAGLWLKNCRDAVVSDNVIHDLVGAPGNTLVSLGGQYDFGYAWFLNNIVYNHDAGIQIASFGGHTVTNITNANPGVATVSANPFINGDQVTFTGISSGMTEVNNNTYTVANVSGNTFELSGTDTTSFGAWTGTGTARVVPQGRYLLGNVVYNMAHRNTMNATDYSENGWLACRANVTDTYIMFNSSYNNDRGMNLNTNVVATVTHNIMSDPTDAANPHFMAQTNQNDLDFNYWRGSTQRLYWQGTVRDITWMKANTAFCGSSQTGTDPLYTNEASAVFTLQAGSACVDNGQTAVPAPFTNFQSRYGFGIANDISMVPRPQNTNYDIGAYERQ